mmetsp:Transcript_127477/g.224564  ORF Transcript_127477/g.224564 Transcript_127477/m.224564 type:complete len:86 (-) Transcript_127477:357-614(-)
MGGVTQIVTILLAITMGAIALQETKSSIAHGGANLTGLTMDGVTQLVITLLVISMKETVRIQMDMWISTYLGMNVHRRLPWVRWR